VQDLRTSLTTKYSLGSGRRQWFSELRKGGKLFSQQPSILRGAPEFEIVEKHHPGVLGGRSNGVYWLTSHQTQLDGEYRVEKDDGD
jgi:hypothetical protein